MSKQFGSKIREAYLDKIGVAEVHRTDDVYLQLNLPTLHGGKGLADRVSVAHFAIAASRAGDHYKGTEKYSLPNQAAMDAGGLQLFNNSSDDSWKQHEVLQADGRLLIPSIAAALQATNALRSMDGIDELLPLEKWRSTPATALRPPNCLTHRKFCAKFTWALLPISC
jgi:hypothetical protein